MGPSVSQGQLETVMKYVEIGQKEGRDGSRAAVTR